MNGQVIQSLVVLFAVFLGFVAFEFKSTLDQIRFEREKRALVLKRLHALLVDYMGCLRLLKDHMVRRNDIALLASPAQTPQDIEMDIRIKLSEIELLTRDLHKIQMEVAEDVQHQILQAVDEGEAFLKTTLHLEHHAAPQKASWGLDIPKAIRRWAEVQEDLNRFIGQIESVLLEK